VTPKGKKQQSKFGLDMEFNEALSRFVHTNPKEVEENIKRSKQKKPRRKKRKKSAGGKKAPPATPVETVISLRDRRMRKRNYGR
jgi:hypothetical protein